MTSKPLQKISSMSNLGLIKLMAVLMKMEKSDAFGLSTPRLGRDFLSPAKVTIIAGIQP